MKPPTRRRRDLCYIIGRRAARLTPAQAVEAWDVLARELEKLGDRDLPKFQDVLGLIYAAAVRGTRAVPNPKKELLGGSVQDPCRTPAKAVSDPCAGVATA